MTFLPIPQSAVSAGLDAFVRQGLPVDLLRPVPQEGDVPSCQYEPGEGEYGLGCRPKEGQWFFENKYYLFWEIKQYTTVLHSDG